MADDDKKSKNKKSEGGLHIQGKALIFLGVSALLFALILYPGENIWNLIHRFFGGLFGIFAFLLPSVLTYIGVITAKEQKLDSKKINKLILCGVALILLSSCIYMFGSDNAGVNHSGIKESYFECIGRLFIGGQSDFANGSAVGILGGLIGYLIVFLCGYTAGELLCVLLLIIDLMFLFGITAKDVFSFFAKLFGILKKTLNQTEFAKSGGISSAINKLSKKIDEKQKKLSNKKENNPDKNQLAKSKTQKPKQIPPEKEELKSTDFDDNFDDDYVDISEFNFGDSFKAVKDKKEKDKEDNKIVEEKKPIEENKTFADMLTKPVVDEKADNKQSKPTALKKSSYDYPPVELLYPPEKKEDTSKAMEELERNGKKLETTLESFGVNAKIINICRGPSVTRFEVQPAPGVKISKITNLADDIALNLATEGVRIEAPIPGKAAVGIEVPNKVVTTVTMRELIESQKFKNSKGRLSVVLGKDISGNIIVTDLSAMPHLLVAGTTGSGKSVCVNSILISLLYRSTPDEVKMLLIDPKMVEFSKYKNIPHLLIPVVTDPKKAAGALNWAVNEMEERYKNFSLYGVRDIGGFNKMVSKYNKEREKKTPEELLANPIVNADGIPIPEEKMHSIVIAIDEFADLMMTAPNEVEESVCRLAQKARAAGIHLVIATQRPSVNVITGVIKANIPSRISLKVSSQMDSRTIIDMGGAEKLIGYGDMLFMPVGTTKPVRVQGCYASDEEIENVTSYVKQSNSAQYNESIDEEITKITEQDLGKNKGKDKESSDNDDNAIYSGDEMLEEAIKLVVESGQASTSLLQRRLRLGYARAGRIIDEMEQLGVVGPHVGSKSREVLMTYQEWLDRQNNKNNQS